MVIHYNKIYVRRSQREFERARTKCRRFPRSNDAMDEKTPKSEQQAIAFHRLVDRPLDTCASHLYIRAHKYLLFCSFHCGMQFLWTLLLRGQCNGLQWPKSKCQVPSEAMWDDCQKIDRILIIHFFYFKRSFISASFRWWNQEFDLLH